MVQPRIVVRYSPFLSCRQASRLITAKLDRALNPLERLGLQLHLSICSACPVVIRQFERMRSAIHEWTDSSEK